MGGLKVGEVRAGGECLGVEESILSTKL
jgi:hypothetical protein